LELQSHLHSKFYISTGGVLLLLLYANIKTEPTAMKLQLTLFSLGPAP